ncbi:hypothetical protein EDC96DRAFT_567725 [Choanephora cucurbitarum]|nr:hypothetical protein EDC96DRAFT_567725 [Choanephora cucurbitarum]
MLLVVGCIEQIDGDQSLVYQQNYTLSQSSYMDTFSALANVFFFSKNESSFVTSFLKQAEQVELLKSVDFKKHMYKLPSIVDTWLSELKDICKDENKKNLRIHLVSLLNSEEAKNKDDLLLAALILSSLLPKHHTRKRENAMEDTFVKNQFADVLDVILSDGDQGILQYECCILKPDYTPEDEEDRQLETFVVEVKAPLRNRNSNDFIKLGFTLKSMLDKLIQSGMKSPHVVGLLIDGYDYSFYMMTIEHESIYKMVQLEAFT